MVSSLIGPQYNNDQFWKFSTSAAAGSANNFDTPMVPTFSSDFEVSTHIILLEFFSFCLSLQKYLPFVLNLGNVVLFPGN